MGKGNDLVSNIDTPSLIVDSKIMDRNLDAMARFAGEHDIDLRPHVKTHKCPELAKLQIRKGAVGIAVAKLSEAEVMVNQGLKDIQIANEVVTEVKIAKLVHLTKKCNLSVAVDNVNNVEMLSRMMMESGTSIDVLIDVDVGLRRCGLSHKKPDKIVRFAKYLDSKKGINLIGIMAHAGQVYRCRNIREVERVGLFEGRKMVELAQNIEKKARIRCNTISVGSTPTVRFSGPVHGITEIRPGNYIFNDNIQVSMGIAKISDCALSVASTVISTPTRNRVIIDAGSKSLGLERGAHGNKTIGGYGHILGRKAEIKKLSEEHGFVGGIHKGEIFDLGERIRIVPNHACYVTNLYDKIVDLRKGMEHQVMARGCSR